MEKLARANRLKSDFVATMYIVHHLLGMLGATIAVESEVNRGSTFRVWLPNRLYATAPQEGDPLPPDQSTKRTSS